MFHFLHIRKTGGTAIKEALRNVAWEDQAFIRLHPHITRLKDIPEGEKVVFFLRDPHTRFVSGFNSRLRRGQPRYNSPWSEGEKIAFHRFPTANSLAEALFAGPLQKQAERAMTDIRHINQPYTYWLESIAYLSSRLKDLVFIGFKETLGENFERLKEILQLPRKCTLPTDAVQAHKTPEGYNTFLSDQAVKNLKKWYFEDYAFIALLKNYELLNSIQRANRRMGTIPEMNTGKQKNDILKEKKNRGSRALALRPETDKILEMTKWWIPSAPAWNPIKKPNSSLRIAVIVNDRLYDGLRFEGDLFLLTPDNWKTTLRYGKLDLLLVESTWETVTGHWNMAEISTSPDYQMLLEILKTAKKLSIPSVFWNTTDYAYHQHYKDFAACFDYVFCADPRESELLHKEGIKSEVLLPCVQPALYNPFRYYEDYHALDIGVLFDGWADLDRYTNELNVLSDIKENFPLSIVESKYLLSKMRSDILPQYKDIIYGCVNDETMRVCLKYAWCYLTFDKSISTRKEREWKVLEAAASRVPILHCGRLSINDILTGLITRLYDRNSLLDNLLFFKKDPLYLEKQGHLAWRHACQNHTFAHRIQQVCRKIGVFHGWNEYPDVSIIIPTSRKNLLSKCVDSFQRQSYPNKELLLVFNGKELSTIDIDEKKIKGDKISVLSVPKDLFAGACLNLGNLNATGSYCFRMDDDDYYGDNYILDMMLHLRSIDADFFGKPVSLYYSFPGAENEVHFRKTKTYPLCIISEEHIRVGHRFSGNSFAGTKTFFSKNFYRNKSYAAADSTFLYTADMKGLTMVSMDCLNMSAERRVDQNGHTWKLSDDGILKKGKACFNHFECISI